MINKVIKSALKKILFLLPSVSYQKNKGFCPCCNSRTSFVSFNSWFRDHYKCIKCNSIPRERALILAISRHYPNWQNLSIHESSPNNSGASLTLRTGCKKYIASQFHPDKPLGENVNGFINQDLEHQTFSDQSFDLVVTQDVLEHVFNPNNALKEICRTLKPGGAHIFSVPLINRHHKTAVWAEKNHDKGVTFIKTPEFHANPVDPKGCPVTIHWGFDILDYIKETTGMNTEIEDEYDLHYGLSGYYLEIFVSKKAGT